jgi:DNA replication protein DnaC
VEDTSKITLKDLGEIPSLYLEARLTDSPTPLTGTESVYFWSQEPGTGKTHLAWAFYINERLKNEKSKPLFSTFGALQLRLRGAMGEGGVQSEQEIIKEFSSRKMVILDDLGGLRPGNASDYSLSMIFEILNNRYSWQRQTIVTSNKSLEGIEADFDARIASRLVGMCKVLELKGADRRLGKK